MSIDAENDLSFKHAKEVFDNYGLTYEVKAGGSMMWVQSKKGRVYGYYPTTHRWAPRHLRGKHYRAKSTEDFVERFVLKTDREDDQFSELMEKRFGVVSSEVMLSDLVDWIWEEIDSGKPNYQVKSDLYKMMFEEVKRVNEYS